MYIKKTTQLLTDRFLNKNFNWDVRHSDARNVILGTISGLSCK